MSSFSENLINRERFVSSVRVSFDSIEVAYLQKNEQSDHVSWCNFVTIVPPPGDEEFEVLFERFQDVAGRLVDKARDLKMYGPQPTTPFEGDVSDRG